MPFIRGDSGVVALLALEVRLLSQLAGGEVRGGGGLKKGEEGESGGEESVGSLQRDTFFWGLLGFFGRCSGDNWRRGGEDEVDSAQ